MNRIICGFCFVFIFATFANAEDVATDNNEKKGIGIYALFNVGPIPYNASSYDDLGYLVGATVGYQATKRFALELAYAFSSIYDKNVRAQSQLGGIIRRNVALANHDIKLNFLYQQEFSISERFSLLPLAGGGLMYSQNAYSNLASSNVDFGVLAKIGLRAKYRVFVLGVNAEYDIRFASTSNLAIVIDAGVMF